MEFEELSEREKAYYISRVYRAKAKWEEENLNPITVEEGQALWDKQFEKYMAMPKEELVKLLIGDRPV